MGTCHTNGVLSFTSAPIDHIEMINKVLDDDVQSSYITSNEELLKDQAKVFYTGIISAIDPEISLNFEYRS